MDAPEDNSDASGNPPAVAKRGVRSVYEGTPPKPDAVVARGMQRGCRSLPLFNPEEGESPHASNSRFALKYALHILSLLDFSCICTLPS